MSVLLMQQSQTYLTDLAAVEQSRRNKTITDQYGYASYGTANSMSTESAIMN